MHILLLWGCWRERESEEEEKNGNEGKGDEKEVYGFFLIKFIMIKEENSSQFHSATRKKFFACNLFIWLE